MRGGPGGREEGNGGGYRFSSLMLVKKLWYACYMLVLVHNTAFFELFA